MIGRVSPVLSAPETRDNTLIDFMLFRSLRFVAPPAISRVSLSSRRSTANGAKRREKHAPDSHGLSQIITAGETCGSSKAKLRLELCTRCRKNSVNTPSFVRRAPRPTTLLALAVGSKTGICWSTTLRRFYDVSDAGISSSSRAQARFCSGLRFHGMNRSTLSTARPPALAHASR